MWCACVDAGAPSDISKCVYIKGNGARAAFFIPFIAREKGGAKTRLDVIAIPVLRDWLGIVWSVSGFERIAFGVFLFAG